MNLDFADDVSIIYESLESLVPALDAFNNMAKPLGLEVKPKIQDIGSLLRWPVQSKHACGKDFEATDSVTYLGKGVYASWLSDRAVGRRASLAAGAIISFSKSIRRCQYHSRRSLCFQGHDTASFVLRKWNLDAIMCLGFASWSLW